MGHPELVEAAPTTAGSAKPASLPRKGGLTPG